MDDSKIREVIQTYFDASFEGSAEKMDRVFHGAAHIYGIDKAGALNDMPRDHFVKMVGAHRTEGQAPAFPRQDEILSVDFTGEFTAVARVKLRVGKTLFTDMLCFMYLEGRWGVIAKVFSGVAVE